mgnify:CR=1 FL=1
MGEPAALTAEDRILISGTAQAVISGVTNDTVDALETLNQITDHHPDYTTDTLILMLAQEYERFKYIAFRAAFLVEAVDKGHLGNPMIQTYINELREALHGEES